MITDEQLSVVEDVYNRHLPTGFCDIDAMRKALEAYEQSKPKPEPVAYKVCNPAGCVLVESRKSAEKLSSEYGNGTYQPLYTTPPTREPLSEVEINDIIEDVLPHGTMLDLIRAIEQAHGIGVKQ